MDATSQLAQTTLRSVLGKHELDEMLAEREKLNIDIQQSLDAQTEAWGIKVSNVEIKQVDLNETMVRAIAAPGRSRARAARQGDPRRGRAAGIGEAGRRRPAMLAQEPQAIQLRYLETLTVIAADKNSTIVFPLPMDFIVPFLAKPKA